MTFMSRLFYISLERQGRNDVTREVRHWAPFHEFVTESSLEYVIRMVSAMLPCFPRISGVFLSVLEIQIAPTPCFILSLGIPGNVVHVMMEELCQTFSNVFLKLSSASLDSRLNHRRRAQLVFVSGI